MKKLFNEKFYEYLISILIAISYLLILFIQRITYNAVTVK